MGWALRDLTPCPDVPLTLRNMTWGPWARPRDTLRSQVGTALLPRAPHLVKLLWMCTSATPSANIKLDITVPPSSGQTASQTTFTRPYSACSWCFLQLVHMSDLILQCSTVWVKCWNPQSLFHHRFPGVITQVLTVSLLKDFSNSFGESGLTGRSRHYSGCWLPAVVNPRSPCTLSTLESEEILKVSGKTKKALPLEPGGVSCQLRTKYFSTINIGHEGCWQRNNLLFV